MMKPDLLSTPRFRYTAAAALLFGALALLAGLLIVYAVQASLDRQLRDHVGAETSQLLGDYRDQGLDELRHDIHERLERSPMPRLLYTVVDPDGRQIFDRVTVPGGDGWHHVRGDKAPDRIFLTTRLEDGYRLIVGAEARTSWEFGRAFSRVFLLCVAGVLVLSLLAGLLVSQRFLTRLAAFERTAEEVGRGAFAARIPASEVDGEFKPLAETINGMLERIEILMNEARHASASIAHDLRTPLGRLRQRLERLRDGQTDEAARQDSEAAIGELDAILETFTSLLRLGELESGRAQIASQPVDLSGLLASLAEAYGPVAAEKGRAIVLHADTPAVVSGDRSLLVQMFSNLLDNAILHGSGDIGIEVTPAHGRVEAIVSDRGTGIPATQRDEVLKPFRRLETSRTTAGSGLGLSLVRSIADRHGASLTLEDNAPGLRVRIVFPGTP